MHLHVFLYFFCQVGSDSIYVLQASFHSHLLARQMRLRHIAANGTELPVLIENKHFDFFKQGLQGLDRERLIEKASPLIDIDII